MADFKEVADFIRERANSSEYRKFMSGLLCELIDIETTTTDRELSDIVAGEDKIFDLIEKTLAEFIDEDVTLERSGINPEIEKHPYYTKVYYTANDEYPLGQPVEKSFKDRCNLLAFVTPKQSCDSGKSVFLNAHVDTVSPFYSSKIDGDWIFGRGACDDKGPVVQLIAAMKLFADVKKKFGDIALKPFAFQFVIEEEPGGNGSLSAALDSRFKGYEAIISEATKNVPFPANRGAMWFQLDLKADDDTNLASVMPFVIRELAIEGQMLRKETDQPLFPKEYVQVNLGTLGGFGQHASAVNDYIPYEIFTTDAANITDDQITKVVDGAIEKYTSKYNDRTKESGDAHLDKHYSLAKIDEGRFKLEIFGVGGHMGAMLLRDNALIKAGYVLSAIVESDLDVELSLAKEKFDPSEMMLTGGVGFTPSHRMEDLKGRLGDAVRRGIAEFNRVTGSAVGEDIIRISFDKLHNEAYASPLDCPAMLAVGKATRELGLKEEEPIAWRASCDARIYANSGYNTIVLGAGDLADAHSDHEKISVSDMQVGAGLMAISAFALVSGEYAK